MEGCARASTYLLPQVKGGWAATTDDICRAKVKAYVRANVRVVGRGGKSV